MFVKLEISGCQQGPYGKISTANCFLFLLVLLIVVVVVTIRGGVIVGVDYSEYDP